VIFALTYFGAIRVLMQGKRNEVFAVVEVELKCASLTISLGFDERPYPPACWNKNLGHIITRLIFGLSDG
jgi:hypothetical protein